MKLRLVIGVIFGLLASSFHEQRAMMIIHLVAVDPDFATHCSHPLRVLALWRQYRIGHTVSVTRLRFDIVVDRQRVLPRALVVLRCPRFVLTTSSLHDLLTLGLCQFCSWV